MRPRGYGDGFPAQRPFFSTRYTLGQLCENQNILPQKFFPPYKMPTDTITELIPENRNRTLEKTVLPQKKEKNPNPSPSAGLTNIP